MKLDMLDLGDGRRIAVRHRRGTGPTVLFLPGYASDMRGSKAEALDAWAATHGRSLLRFDYSGTGESSGHFEDGTFERWLGEATAVAALAEGPLVLVGSSMGGWLMLHLAEHLGPRVQAMVGIAAAPDFIEWGYDAADKDTLRREGRLVRANPYGGDSQLTTLAFWESGQRHRLLHSPIAFDRPVRLLHGDADSEVPLDVALRLKNALASRDVRLTVVKGGTHRLSEPAELRLLVDTVAVLCAGDASPT